MIRKKKLIKSSIIYLKKYLKVLFWYYIILCGYRDCPAHVVSLIAWVTKTFLFSFFLNLKKKTIIAFTNRMSTSTRASAPLADHWALLIRPPCDLVLARINPYYRLTWWFKKNQSDKSWSHTMNLWHVSISTSRGKKLIVCFCLLAHMKSKDLTHFSFLMGGRVNMAKNPIRSLV